MRTGVTRSSKDGVNTTVELLKPIGLGFGIALGSTLFNWLMELFR